jgi:hypothetical protein
MLQSARKKNQNSHFRIFVFDKPINMILCLQNATMKCGHYTLDTVRDDSMELHIIISMIKLITPILIKEMNFYNS